jgi:hypothetical protein
VGNPSHIWVVGDNVNGSDMVELDAAGRVVSNGAIDLGATGNHQALARDANGIVWVGDFRNGDLLSYDPATGIVSNVINLGYPVLGLANGPFGGIWASLRPMSGRSLLRRIDPTTGMTEIELEIGFGVLQEVDTRFQFAHVIDPVGDEDGDGTISVLEINDGTSPIDPCSTPMASLATSGSSRLGATLGIEVSAPAGAPSAIAFSVGAGLLTPGISLPGANCTFRLDLTTLLPFTATTVGTASLPVPIPAAPSATGLVLRFQALTIGAVPQFSNVAGALVFM